MILSMLALSIAALPHVNGFRGYEDLEPSHTGFSTIDSWVPYENALGVALLDESIRRDCQLVAAPASESEWCVYLFTKEEKHPQLVFRQLRTPMSCELYALLAASASGYSLEDKRAALAKVKIEVDTLTVPLTPATANALTEAWWAMLERVGYRGVEIPTHDGTQYFFSHWTRSGWTWTPKEGTRTAALVRLAEGMRDLAKAPPDSRGDLERALALEARALLERLRKLSEAAGAADRDR